MSGHTPGPWRFDAEYGRVEADGRRVCDMPSAGLSLYPEEYEANARLIAAAPAMLEALRRIASQSLWSDNEANFLGGYSKDYDIKVFRHGMSTGWSVYKSIAEVAIAAAAGEEDPR